MRTATIQKNVPVHIFKCLLVIRGYGILFFAMKVVKIVLVLLWVLMMAVLIREKFLFTSVRYARSPILKEGDYWIGIFHEGKRAGFCHTVNTPSSMSLYAELLINFLGEKQSIKIDGSTNLGTHGKIDSFSFKFATGEHEIKAYGRDVGKDFLIRVDSGGTSQTQITIHGDITISDFSIPEIDLIPGEKRKLNLINPITGMRETAVIETLGYQYLQGSKLKLAKLDYFGSTSRFWIREDGEIQMAEIPLGFTLLRESKEDALCIRELPEEELVDILSHVAVDAGVMIENPEDVKRLVLRIDGVKLSKDSLLSERQKMFGDGLLEVSKASLPSNILQLPIKNENFEKFLHSSLFINPDDERIRKKALEIAGAEKNSWEAAKKINNWLFTTIRKVPVAGLPASSQTLISGEGDCNEHTFLFVALARSLGIPSEVCTGLTYYDGKFYYHCWPKVYVGEWVEMDPTLGQEVCDATHIKLVEGGIEDQMSLAGIIGKIRIEIVQVKYDKDS